MYCSEMKKKITSKRIEMGLFKLNLLRTDVIPIVNYAWKRSFAKERTNLKAISDRGWGPLNRILLSHPEIKSTNLKNESPIESNDGIHDNSPIAMNATDLNINGGFAGNVIASILRQAQRDQQTIENLNKSKEDGLDFTTAMKNTTKWTAGVLFDKGKCYLDEEVLRLASDAREKKESKFWETIRSNVSTFKKIKKDYEVSALKLKEYLPDKVDKLPIKVLSLLCKWKRRKADNKMPLKRTDLLV